MWEGVEMSETKFPDFSHPRHSNRYWHYADNGSLSEFDWECHDKDILDWFKRCIEDFPYTEKYDHREDENVFLYKLAADRYAWFVKWFNPFFPHVCDKCKNWKNNECQIQCSEGHVSGFDKTVNPQTNRIVRCSYFMSSGFEVKGEENG